MEHQTLERKSLRLIGGRAPDWEALAREAVCFANARGGEIHVGVEDGETLPPPEQRVAKGLPERVLKRIGELTMNVEVAYPTIEQSSSGGEYLRIVVPRSQGVACTSEGRYFVRVSDECKPVMPEGLNRLFEDRGSYEWELRLTETRLEDADAELLAQLCQGLRTSDRVKPHVKEKSDAELAEHYHLSEAGRLSHLGVLWIGRPSHRARLPNAPIVQLIRYDEHGEKAAPKLLFGDDYAQTPKGIFEAIEQLDLWREGTEVAAGLFRDFIPNYDLEVIRELVANALVHRMYTIRGDIYLNLHPDRLEIHSPGPLPTGVTPQNILHARVRRNEKLTRLFHDLGLMETEGSGYDRIYRVLLSTGKPVPEIEEETDRVKVVVRGRDLDPQALRVVSHATSAYGLTREREVITLGLIARYGPLSADALTRHLALKSVADLGTWIGDLASKGLIVSRGKGRGALYRVNPKLIRASGYRARTTLVDIEDYRLRELIRTDIEHYPNSAISDIIGRVGKEIARPRFKRQLRALVEDGAVSMTGERSTARYRPITERDSASQASSASDPSFAPKSAKTS